MAGTVPSEARALYTFANAHAPLWLEHFAEIGMSEEQAALVAEKVPELLAAIREAEAARQAAMALTDAMNLKSRELFEAAAMAVRAIRVHAINNDDPHAYTLAQIDPPKVRSRHAALPVAPTDVSFRLDGCGGLILSWIAPQPRGVANVSFDVRRALNDSFTFEFVGASGDREFHDQTIPLGTTQVRYILTPRHGKRTGTPSKQFTTQFGSVPQATLALASPRRVA